jgi:hypothetical protein
VASECIRRERRDSPDRARHAIRRRGYPHRPKGPGAQATTRLGAKGTVSRFTTVCRCFQVCASLCNILGGWTEANRKRDHGNDSRSIAKRTVRSAGVLPASVRRRVAACEWLQVEVGQGLEERFDYALLRERAKRADDDPIREIERLQVSANGGPSTRECWSCGEVLLVQRVNCPSCGRTQGGI